MLMERNSRVCGCLLLLSLICSLLMCAECYVASKSRNTSSTPSYRNHRRAGETQLCTFCENAVQFIEGYLAENATEEDIIASLRTICLILPTSNFTNECVNFVQNEVPQVIYYVMYSETPQYACIELGICPYGGGDGKATQTRHKTKALAE